MRESRRVLGYITKLNRYSRTPTDRERGSESEHAEGGREPGKDERDVKDRKCEHTLGGISESSRQSLLLHSGGLIVLMAACSAFSVSISTAMG